MENAVKRHSTAVLVYGYDLGGVGMGWKLQGMTDQDSDDTDLTDEWEERLLMHYKIDPVYTAARPRGHRVAPVHLTSHGGIFGTSAWALTTKEVWAHEGGSLEVHFRALERESHQERWNDDLTEALRILEITPTQLEPRWLLVSSYG